MSDTKLFEPAKLGTIELKNRIVMAPLTRSRANEMAVPAEFSAEYYAQRAGAGLIITEATQFSFEGMGYPRTPALNTPEQVARWRDIVDAVHGAGGKIAVQLWHCGRIVARENRGVPADVVAPSAIQAPGQMYTDAKGMIDHAVPRALETDEIARISGEFAAAAKLAMETGFDGVELHSANGYLLHQFLSTNVNQRTDRYGGSIENRVRMPLEVLDAILGEVPADKVGIRISPGHAFNGIEESDRGELYAHYVGELDKRKLAYLHVMRAFANKVDADVVAEAREAYSGNIIVCGGYDYDSATQAVASGVAQAVAFGKAYIANPDLVERFAKGAPLNEPNEATFYTPGREGYTDYPTLAQS